MTDATVPELDWGIDEPQPAQPDPSPGIRLSVSALRDYRRCPAYYKYKRVDRIPEQMTHHAPAGNLVHSAFYVAYGNPRLDIDPSRSGRTKLTWEVSGDFQPNDALAIFDALWWRDRNDPDASNQHLERLPGHLLDAYALLSDDLNHVDNFARGQKKSLKATSQAELRLGWHEHFRDMLAASLTSPLPLPVMEIEREVSFHLGGVEMKAYLDLILDASKRHGPDSEVHVDLKTGQNKPVEAELFFDDQIQSYYHASGGAEFWLYHMRSGTVFAIDRNETLITSLAEMAAQDAVAIQSGYFPKRYDKQVCSRCPFRKECHGT